ncbi:MAG: glycine dehydrogenase (aminomethyl-transferring), partial [Chitinophagales bacterium]|nr:glycine dehydrogenase (aminomethyl-transferring) [Chitinophagales bacterium]
MSSKHFFATDHFVERHIGTSPQQVAYMLQQLHVDSLDQLINETVPPNIQLTAPLAIGDPMSEYQYLQHVQQLMSRNQLWKSYIGMGYYGTIVPAVIQRNIFENPGWYTQYTPYQAEIAQGRLEALLNFQTVICDLTNMPVANASLLDEATAAAEAMQMLHRTQNKNPKAPQNNTFLVADNCLPATIEVLKTRAEPLG